MKFTDQMMCTHEDFDANVAVARLEDTGGFMADITISPLPGQPIAPPVSADIKTTKAQLKAVLDLLKEWSMTRAKG